jgi:eukaryotic-like serine/threonine-protein kinase
MELVEGPTLADRLEKGAFPLDEALPIAKQIAEALEAAHEQGIIHRDLKPANVKLRDDGAVKVLDFGLAKALDPISGVRPDVTSSPTITTPAMTQVGMILGTAAYMSPEQAKGRPADKRSDVWAFGVVLYEMLTGRQAFEGEAVTEVLGRVLTTDVDWSRLPSSTPAPVRRLLQRALQKDSRHRLGDIRDARLEIEEARTPSSEASTTTSVRGARLAWSACAAAIATAVVLAVPTARHLLETRPPEMRLEINTPSTPAPLQFAISHDGRYVVFVASGDGPQRLWLRALNKTDAKPIPGTEGAEYPFWSKDSRSIGFFASGKLFRVDIDGGQPQAIADAPQGRSGAWNADGTIILAPAATSALFRVSASGGEPVAVTTIDEVRGSHRYPQFLADGRHFLFYDQSGSTEVAGIYLASLDAGRPKRLTAADTAGAFLPPNRIVYIRQGALVARPLDVARGEWTGDPVVLADRVGYDPTFNLGAFSISDDGRIAYRATAGRQQLTWYDRTGKPVGVVGEPDVTSPLYPELSPDGKRVALTRTLQNNPDIWLMDVVRGSLTRVTSDPAIDNSVVWSPDGTRLVFASSRRNKANIYNLYIAPANGQGEQKLLLETPNFKIPQDWSWDGRYLVYFEVEDPRTGRDLWVLDMTEKNPKPRVVVDTPFEESLAQFSPDGRWIAYQTNASGRFEIVVQGFPDPSSGAQHVSTNGGIAPRWRADGREIYFIAPDGKLMASTVSVTGSTLETGAPVALFQTRIAGGGFANLFRPQYAVSRDGRFLINQVAEEAATPITLILNWQPSAR